MNLTSCPYDDIRVNMESPASFKEISMAPPSPDSKDDDSSIPNVIFTYQQLCSIFKSERDKEVFHRVPHRLREVNPTAYEPDVISIGPYHYGTKHLKSGEVMKRSCFPKVVEIINDLKYSEYEEAMKIYRECYDGPIHPDLENNFEAFINMMIHDGCFIVLLIRVGYPEELRKLGRHVVFGIKYDLLMLENQLPFFLLDKLDEIMIKKRFGVQTDFSTAALTFFQGTSFPGAALKLSGKRTDTSSPLHLLDLVHKCCRPSPQGSIEQPKEPLQEIEGKGKQPKEPLQEIEGKGKSQRSWKFIRSATELDDAGIHFLGIEEKVLEDKDLGLFDIMFTKRPFTFKIHKKVIEIPMLCAYKKVLEIPTLRVTDSTEPILRNLVAHEQFTWGSSYVCDYVVFMDNLINTDKDVQLLCTSGVIDNWLGDDEAVAQMFNRLGDRIYSSKYFYYAKIFDDVNKHCNREWNKYKAKLRKDYFGSPWSYCSFFAALVLLVVTVLQTVYALISYYHPK